jgi:calcineurin-like phosphoesterase family protein
VDEHDALIKENILSTLTKRSKLFILGDIAFTSDAGDWVVGLVKYVPNTVIVLGNHDTDSIDRLANIVKYANAGIKLHGLSTYKDAWLSHCPIHPDEMRKKKFNIHGHCHGRFSPMIDLGDGDYDPDNRYFDVSCENVDYKPIRYDQILERLL